MQLIFFVRLTESTRSRKLNDVEIISKKQKIKPLLVSIVGPTAIGKSDLGIELAKHYQTEVISADSRQLYREMKIGTAKPDAEELAEVTHHFIDSHSIEASFSAGEYGRQALSLLSQRFEEKKIILAVGGSTLYLKALWDGFDDVPRVDESIRKSLNQELKEYGLSPLLNELAKGDPTYFDQVDKSNGQRIVRALEVLRGTGKPFSSYRKNSAREFPYRNLKIGLEVNREVLFERINKRMDHMIDAGLFEEAESLLEYRNHNALQTVGYSEIFGFLDGDYDREEAIRLLKRNSRRYAKRQMTWFRKYEDIHWFDPNQKAEIIKLIDSSLSGE